MKRINEIWDRRVLIFNLSLSELKMRYRNSVLGFIWTFLEPLLMLLILYFVFTNIFRFEIPNYELYILSGLVLWGMFSRGTSMGLDCISSKGGILKQIYMPREIPVIVSTITSTIMLFFEICVFGLFLIGLQFVPTKTVIIFPLMIFLLFIVVIGVSFALSVLSVKFKDFKFLWTVVIQAGFFLTPIFYKLDILPEILQKILYFSPIAQIIDISHDALLYDKFPENEVLITVIGTSLLTLIIGYDVYRKMENRIMEEL